MTDQLSLFAAEPPLLALLRKLCAGVVCHPCPGGVTLDYLVWAGAGEQPEDRARVLRQLEAMKADGLVTRQVLIDEDGDGEEVALWRPK